MSLQGARELVASALGGTPYVARALELMDVAAHGASDEAVAVWTERDDAVHAVALVGLVSGAVGAGRVHLMVGHDPHIVDRACDVLRAMGARFAMAEWPDDATFAPAVEMLRTAGFREVGRIPDFYRAGTAQVFLRRNL
jgi:hypothetical protein